MKLSPFEDRGTVQFPPFGKGGLGGFFLQNPSESFAVDFGGAEFLDLG